MFLRGASSRLRGDLPQCSLRDDFLFLFGSLQGWVIAGGDIPVEEHFHFLSDLHQGWVIISRDVPVEDDFRFLSSNSKVA